LLGNKRKKRIRKNYLKNSRAKRRARMLTTLGTVLKGLSLFAGIALMSFAFIFGHDLLTQTSFFNASSIQVSGCERLSHRQVIEHAGVYTGKNIFSINLATTRKRLLAHPWIREAEICREVPSGLSIRIKEYEPLAVIDLKRRYLIDVTGKIFKECEDSDPAGLPVITGLNLSDLNVDNSPFSRPFSAIMSVLKLGQKRGSTIPIEKIHSIDVDRDIGLTLHVKDRATRIHLGYNDYKSKYLILKEVLVYFNSNSADSNFRSIDLNNPNRIVVNMDTEASPAMGHKEV